MPNRWWSFIEPGFWWDADDSVFTNDTMALGLEVGRAIRHRVSLSAKPSVRIFGSEEFGWALDFTASVQLP